MTGWEACWLTKSSSFAKASSTVSTKVTSPSFCEYSSKRLWIRQDHRMNLSRKPLQHVHIWSQTCFVDAGLAMVSDGLSVLELHQLWKMRLSCKGTSCKQPDLSSKHAYLALSCLFPPSGRTIPHSTYLSLIISSKTSEMTYYDGIKSTCWKSLWCRGWIIQV